MIYDTLTKGDDGLRIVKVLGDDKRKVFIQLNNVSVVGKDSEEITLDLSSSNNIERISGVDDLNITAAQENSDTWFGKKLIQQVIKNAYTSSMSDSNQITGECVSVTKIFNSQKEVVDSESLTDNNKCDVILEFAGLWFGKKVFGPTWNIIQVRLHEEPIIDTYPDEYAFVDEVQE